MFEPFHSIAWPSPCPLPFCSFPSMPHSFKNKQTAKSKKKAGAFFPSAPCSPLTAWRGSPPHPQEAWQGDCPRQHRSAVRSSVTELLPTESSPLGSEAGVWSTRAASGNRGLYASPPVIHPELPVCFSNCLVPPSLPPPFFPQILGWPLPSTALRTPKPRGDRAPFKGNISAGSPQRGRAKPPLLRLLSP